MMIRFHAHRVLAALLILGAGDLIPPSLHAEEVATPAPQEAVGLPRAPSIASAGEQVPVSVQPAPEAVLLVAGQEIYRMKAPLGPFSATERAEAARSRIREIILSPQFEPDDIHVLELDGQLRIMNKDHTLFTVLPADYPVEEQPDIASEAHRVARSLVAAIDMDRTARTPRRLATASGLTLLVLVLVIFLGRLLLLGFRWLKERITGAKGRVLRGIHFRGLELVSVDSVIAGALKLADLARAASLLVLAYVAVAIVLVLFPWTQPYGRASATFVLGAMGRIVRGIIGFIPDLFMIALIVVVIRYLNRFVSFIFDAVGRGALVIPSLHPELAAPTKQLSRLLVWIFGLVVIFPYLPGSGTPAFQGVSVFIGLMVSFGSAGAIGSLVAGLVLTYTRSFSVGDRVKIADTIGDVVSHGMLSTKVVTIKNEEITIPNAAILGNHIVNYTEMADTRGLILHTTVTIGYDAPWRQVHELLIAAARATTHILAEPAPFVLQTSLDDFYVSYQINAYTRDASRMAVIYGELHQNIQDAFFKAGVEIMSPHHAAIRDGNRVAIPSESLPGGYQAPRFGLDVRRGEGPDCKRP